MRRAARSDDSDGGTHREAMDGAGRLRAARAVGRRRLNSRSRGAAGSLTGFGREPRPVPRAIAATVSEKPPRRRQAVARLPAVVFAQVARARCAGAQRAPEWDVRFARGARAAVGSVVRLMGWPKGKSRPPRSAAHTAKLSASLREHYAENGVSDETRAKLSASLREHYAENGVSDETRAKRSASLREHYACFHCGFRFGRDGAKEKLQPVEGISGARECIDERACERRILARGWA